jgi:hypothetical protein
MRDLVYYPGFEILDESWLKFALLYIDCIHPIIPESGMSYLGEKTKHVMRETDLINPYSPQYHEGEVASKNSLYHFERYLKNPERYVSTKGFKSKGDNLIIPFRAKNMLNKWKDVSSQNYTIFSEKYSWVFEQFCLENKLAHHSEEGLQISEELAYVYMSLLADEIAKLHGYDAITDKRPYNELLLSEEKRRHNQRAIKSAENIIKLSIPRNLEDIPLEKIISLRNDETFSKARKAYVKELSNFLDNNRDNNVDNISNEALLNCAEEMWNIILKVTSVVASLGVFSMTGMDFARGAAVGVFFTTVLKEIVMDGDRIHNSRISMNRIKNKIIAKRYLAEIEKL